MASQLNIEQVIEEMKNKARRADLRGIYEESLAELGAENHEFRKGQAYGEKEAYEDAVKILESSVAAAGV